MTELGHQRPAGGLLQGFHRRQIRAGDEEMGFAGDGEGLDLPGSGSFVLAVEFAPEFDEGTRAQRGRFAVVQPVVQGQQREFCSRR